MYLIVGLGNYGSQYAMNRHNIGFITCDYWLKAMGGSDYRDEHKALTKKFKLSSENKKITHDILIAKPQTYMNKSGESVVSLLNFYKIEKQNLLVIQDDIDQPFGAMKFQHNRGHGGQNGVRNISELLGSPEYSRLKIGVGRPADPRFDIADYVLGNFSHEQQAQLPQLLEVACDAIESFIFEGLNKASTKYNKTVTLT